MSDTKNTPRERPILFGDALVRAILDDRKTQTRRPVTRLPRSREGMAMHSLRPCLYGDGWSWHDEHGNCHGCNWTVRNPFGRAGDRLWVRECWGVGTRPDPFTGWRDGLEYRADGIGLDERDDLPLWPVTPPDDVDLDALAGRWRPSIHMPRWASRLLLDVVDVRVERLQDIAEEDARAEGATSRPKCHGYEQRYDGWSMDWSRVGTVDRLTRRQLTESEISLGTARMAFANAWIAIYGAESWDANPWVWVVEFKRATGGAR